MRYIDESLAPGEEVIARGKYPMVFWVAAWAALIVLGIIVVGVFISLRSWIVMKTTDFAVTNRRVILKRGWLNRQTHELAVESVEGVSLDQSFWDRLFGYGRVVVTGTGEARIVFPPMSDPVGFRRAIEAARSSAHEVRVVHDTPANDAEPEEVERKDRKPRRKRSFIGLR